LIFFEIFVNHGLNLFEIKGDILFKKTLLTKSFFYINIISFMLLKNKTTEAKLGLFLLFSKTWQQFGF